ncbi:MAG: hypothetical protein JWO38_7683 [Gemmataceae bacterium]|nr:hypothetical protein [Gemmataceae bacterium]
MTLADAQESATIGFMAKKSNSGGKNKTPRVNVGVPEAWHAVIRRVAAKRQQPILFTLISLVIQEAERLELTDLPPAPWDEEELAN